MADETIYINPYNFDKLKQSIASITLEVDFMLKSAMTTEPYDTDEMAREFTMMFNSQAFTVGQGVSEEINWANNDCIAFHTNILYSCLDRF